MTIASPSLDSARRRHGVAAAWRKRATSIFISHSAIAGILVLALFLRLYGFQLMGWMPDNYEQMLATRRLVNLEFPLSRIYAPGIAIIMAPLYLVLPQTLGTMQSVVSAAGIALVPVAYVSALRLTGDRTAATLGTFAIATDTLLVYQSRDSHYDALITLLVTGCLFAVPLLRGRGVGWFAAFGFLLSLLINIRPVNGACMPALLLYWHLLEARGFSLPEVRRTLVGHEALATGAALVVLTVVYAVMGGWLGAATSRPSMEAVSENLTFYESLLVLGLPGLAFVPVLAVAGTARLLRLNRPLALAVIFIIVVWPLAYAPFQWHSVRYMLPARFFVWYLAGFGVVELAALTRNLRVGQRASLRAYLAIAMISMGALLVVPTALLLSHWPEVAAQSDEGVFQELRPVVAGYQPGAMLLSTMTRGLRDTNPRLEYVDLIDRWYADDLNPGIGSGTAALTAQVEAAIAARRPVYYVYSRMEAGSDFSGGHDGFGLYYDTLRRRFDMTEVYRTERTNLDKHAWVVYSLSGATQR
jgi:hypothetical protein